VNRWIGTVVGFLGVCVVLKPTGGAAGLGSFNMSWLLILAAATMFSSLDVLNKVFVGRESFWAMIFYTALFTTLIFSPFAFMGWVAPTMTQYGALAALGAGANALLYCLLKSFSMVDASALAPFRYTELILSAGVGWVLFKEAISMNTILGAMVIVPSTLYVVWKENQKKEE
jgi:drug/metabolite transporter (DMT)-like permease